MAAKDRLTGGRLFKLRSLNQDIIELEDGGSAGSGPRLELRDDQFYVVDPADVTKKLRFDAGSVTAATTRVVTLPDADINLGTGVGGLRSVIDTGGAFATPIVLTAADSGKVYLLDDAAGLDFTLPAVTAANVGMTFKFLLQTEPTSNSYRWTAQAADLLIGRIIIFDKDVVEGSTEALLQLNRPDGTDDLICTITGTDDTQGSLVGGSVEFTAITATRWWVEGILIGDGALATNFS
jgi:hypothetical protein